MDAVFSLSVQVHVITSFVAMTIFKCGTWSTPSKTVVSIIGINNRENKKEYTTQKFYLSTRMANDSNDCIIQMSMHFPNSLVEVDLKHFNEEGASFLLIPSLCCSQIQYFGH